MKPCPSTLSNAGGLIVLTASSFFNRIENEVYRENIVTAQPFSPKLFCCFTNAAYALRLPERTLRS